MFAVKEIFYTLQGEGANVGRAAVFCRFAGCNLWSGLEKDRADAICDFCDTDFVGVDGEGGGRFETATALVDAIDAAWPSNLVPTLRVGTHGRDAPRPVAGYSPCDSWPQPLRDAERPDVRSHAERGNEETRKFVVCTGGEPLLQMTEELVRLLHERGFEVAIETNGTKLPPPGIDWICISPKANAELVLRSGNELKLIYPQVGAEPSTYEALAFEHFFLQPMDGPEREHNTRLAVRYCLEHPRWRLSLQTQKYLGIK